MNDKLKLTALDADDLGVISAACQDALVAVRDCAYFKDEKRFVLLLNRFRWEADPTVEAAYSRTHSALVFNEVTAVRHRDIPLHEPDRMLELLAVAPGKRPFGHAAVRRRPRHPAGNRPSRVPFGGCRGALGDPLEARPSGRIAPHGVRRGAGIRYWSQRLCRAKPTRS